MTGYESKRAAAQDKLDDDDTQVYQDHDDALTIAYQSGYYDGKKAAQPAQEPVLVVEKKPDYMSRGHFYTGTKPHIDPTKIWSLPIGTKLYTIPPQRTWIGLTDKDRMQILDTTEGDERGFVMKLVEDRLRSKNT